ncbi:MAG TPA: ABC transporter permease [Chryseosolibacter sp.]|nr:ABC transporter permease [Chryseosolibacter sp.]
MDINPPKFAKRLLSCFLRDDLTEEVQGDLEEKFYRTLRKRSALRARVNYWYQVLHYMRPFAIRKRKSSTANHYDMFHSYFKIGVRNLLKSKFFSLINISGMAISMAIFFVIVLYISDELQFDKHIDDSHLKFRVYNEHFVDDGSRKKAAMIPPMVAPTMAAEYPQVEYYVRFLNFNAAPLFEAGDKKFTEDNGGAADPRIFDMFSLDLLEGNRSTALKEPNTVAINETLKRKYFGDKPAVGESLIIFDQEFKVVAVFEDFPPHSHFQRNYFLALEGTVPAERMQGWGWNQFHTYIKLRPGADVAALDASLESFAERNAWPVTKPDGGYYIPHLMPVEKVHLYAYDHMWDIAVRGNIQTIYILTGIAGFILVIAILNFVNLSTARAINRVKEVGVRKVMGAFRTQLIYQFISESVLVAMMALAIAALVTSIALPYLNAFTEKHIPTGIFLTLRSVLMLLAFGLLTGMLAGIYPAIFVSSYRPAHILSNKLGGGSGKTLFRQGLVVFQFILSFFLIIGSFVVSEQHTFMRTTDMGFEKENLVVLPIRGDMERKPETAKQSFADHPNILSATLGYGLPGQAYAGDGFIDKATGKNWHTNMLIVDHDYIKTLGLEVIAGRDFSKEIPYDESSAFILSETAAKMLGYTDYEKALGHEIAWTRWDAPDSLKEGTVIGIVKDVQLNSMRENIAPLALQVYPFGYATLTLRIKPNDIPATITHLEKTWKVFNSEWPFEYKFLDENFDKMYKAEEKLAALFRIFTGFTILVACLGLFGLVVYSTSQRYKEISIRKVLGANEGGLVVLLSGNYAILIGIAFLIAAPLSYYAAWQWLQTFAFRIPITATLFIKAGLLIMVISFITVGIQAYKATLANPVDALKEQ